MAFADGIGYPVIIKPPAGSGGRGTYRLDTREHLVDCLATMPPSADAPSLIEEFVVGEEHSFDAISIGGRVVWHSINHYSPSPLEVLREPWIQWCVLLPREIDAAPFDGFREIGFRAVGALGLETGLSHMEWFDRGERGVAISEVGARPPGARITTATPFDVTTRRSTSRWRCRRSCREPRPMSGTTCGRKSTAIPSSTW